MKTPIELKLLPDGGLVILKDGVYILLDFSELDAALRPGAARICGVKIMVKPKKR